MKKITGFLKRSQEFRNNGENGKYFFILDVLHNIASKYHNDLPSTFAIENISGSSIESVEYVLASLYPERKYFCNVTASNTIYCVRH